MQYISIDPVSKRYIYQLNINELKKISSWSEQFEWRVCLDSADYYKDNQSKYAYHKFDILLAFNYSKRIDNKVVNLFDLDNHFKLKKDWLFGYFSYDLKNEIFHGLKSKPARFSYSNLFFFEPECVITKCDDEIFMYSKTVFNESLALAYNKDYNSHPTKGHLESIESKASYIDKINKIKAHIQQGNVYELNYCQTFNYSYNQINLSSLFNDLKSIAPNPFSCYLKLGNNALISVSPERYLAKRNSKIISQPIKGTISVGKSREEYESNRNFLKNSEKEKAENVMIVDLVRNDLSKIAKKASVHVEELYGIYPFSQYFQMISTVVAELKENVLVSDIIKASFPMGSMTGAPKLRAIQLIDELETNPRELFSGAVGYFSPDGDFDFNVVIRSLQINLEKQFLSFTTGSAITILSDSNQEYEETLLKAKAIFELLNLTSI
ncbi:MAG: anthranilate synthase component I family protein [Bacteroidales bacterium]|nr:anthranilate synthase component I family protein [Bacteroidales bacterium]